MGGRQLALPLVLRHLLWFCRLALLNSGRRRQVAHHEPVGAAGWHHALQRHFDCWRKVVANEGPLALYKGFIPGWLRLGPWQLVFWCSYEQLRILTGIGSFK